MCGIAGFIGPWDFEILEAMTSQLIHRGPDDFGYHHAVLTNSNNSIGLGHRRLSIIDLSSGRQPIWNEDHTKVIIFNGEIYNYTSLRRDLQRRSHVFSTQTDTEVILHGFEEFGPHIVNCMEGMFAFAIWDQTSQTLFIARDRFGIKPLYYQTGSPDLLAFGSEIRALLPVVGSRILSKEALYHYLLYGFIMQGESMIKGIFHLPAGSYMVWQNGSLTMKSYWSLQHKDFKVTREEDWSDLVQSALSKAVESHLVADVPVGITLSGGVDSSAVLAMMSRGAKQTSINSFTIGYNRSDDETRYSRMAASPFNIKVHERNISLKKVSERFRELIYYLEEPLAHPVLGTTFFLAEAVHEKLKVVLIGEGSDELFAGYPHYRLFRFPYSLAPDVLKRDFFFRTAYLMPDAGVYSRLFKPEWLDRQMLDHVSHMYDSYFSQGTIAQGALRFEIEKELIGNQLLRIDKLMMAHSVEARVPFLDRNLVEVAYSVPFRLKQKNRIEKYILRKAVESLLPREVVYRPKSGKLGTQALLQPLLDEGLQPLWSSLLSVDAVRRRGIFKDRELTEYLEKPLSAWQKLSPVSVRQRPKFLLALLTLEMWCRIFLDQESE